MRLAVVPELNITLADVQKQGEAYVRAPAGEHGGASVTRPSTGTGCSNENLDSLNINISCTLIPCFQDILTSTNTHN